MRKDIPYKLSIKYTQGMHKSHLKILSVISILLSSNLFVSPAAAEPNKGAFWTSIRYQGLNLGKENAIKQSITLVKIPSEAFTTWSLNVGNSAGPGSPLSFFVELSSLGWAVFGFQDSPSNVSFSVSGDTRCDRSSPNAFGQSGTYRAQCVTNLKLIEGETYEIVISPSAVNDATSWFAYLVEGNSKKINLGNIKFESAAITLKNSSSMYAFNQLYIGSPPNKTLGLTCNNLPNADTIFTKPVNLNLINSVSEQVMVTKRENTNTYDDKNQAVFCDGVPFRVNSDGSTLLRPGGNLTGTFSTPAPTPKPSNSSATSSTPTPSNGTDLVAKPNISLINFEQNNLNLNIYLGNSKVDSAYAVIPGLAATFGEKIVGQIKGNSAVWSLPMNKSLSGKLIPIKFISVKDGIESEPTETTVQIPELNFGKSIKSPAKPNSLRSNFIGTDLIVTAMVEITGEAVPEEAFLYSNDLSIPKNKAIQGEIIGKKVFFSVTLSPKQLGKKVVVNVFTRNSVGSSPTAISTIQIPGARVIPSQTAAPNLIYCAKGNLIRTFQGLKCPPGWSKR